MPLVLLSGHSAPITSLQFYSPYTPADQLPHTDTDKNTDGYPQKSVNNNVSQPCLMSSSFDSRLIQWYIPF